MLLCGYSFFIFERGDILMNGIRRGVVFIPRAAFVFGLSSCRSVSGSASSSESAVSSLPASILPESYPSPTPGEISSLTVWIPAAFQPGGGSAGGDIFTRRIEAFEQAHPGLDVIVRRKAPTGSGGLRDSLAVTSAVAPAALPDLIALDPSDLRAAAIKGLIYPIDYFLTQNRWEGLFPYALSMVRTNSRYYGFPILGDALVLAGSIDPQSEPEIWSQTDARYSRIIIPLADDQALFLFFGYYAAGGAPVESISKLEIQTQPLEAELNWLQVLQGKDVLSPESFRLDTWLGALQAVRQAGECAATSYSAAAREKNFSITYLPTPEGARFSLATGWAWAISTADPFRQTMAAELMLWLSDPQFLADWSLALGVLPPSLSALAFWPAGAPRNLAGGILEHALRFPDDDIAASLGPVLAKAAQRVLRDGVSPALAALEAAQAVNP
jgi:multiple sugar transport system substrate-binding protein